MDFDDDSADIEPPNELCRYGTALPPYEIDEIPSKKPLQIEDQVVKDENGRRRFHGAFTGGFSAGYWNTVGSKEGFTPTGFKSSRTQKAIFASANPNDFMDEEDLGEFGIAPQKIQTKDDYSSSGNSSKRKFERPSDGPIPGDPVLRGLLKPIHDKAAVRILKSMGWRTNQGVGSRLTYNQKKRENERNRRELFLQGKDKKDTNRDEESDDEDEEISDDENITFAPDDFDPFIATFKTNLFGLGYSGLRPELPKQNINLFGPSLQFVGKNNKKISITGQAFGVGAFEEDDDDIYARDDMSQYDRIIDNSQKDKEIVNKPAITYPKKSSLEGFNASSTRDCSVKIFEVEISRNFVARNWLKRRTRFEPLKAEKQQEMTANSSHRILGLGRHDLKPEDRMKLLSDEPKKDPIEPPKEPATEPAKPSETQTSNLTKLSELNKKNSSDFKGGKFRPFALNEEKQARYEKFLEFKSSDPVELESFFNDIQPSSLSKFEREMERKEFTHAKKMYQPLDSLMSSRFVKECDIENEKIIKEQQDNKEEPKKITRTRVMWKPHKDLCKRFNIPEPFGGMMVDMEEEKDQKKKKESKSLFDFIGCNINSKKNFELPQVIPKNFTPDVLKKSKPEIVVKQTQSPKENQDKITFKEVMEPVKLKLPEPSNELEKQVVDSIDKKPEEKKELFKAIFCDSDDDDEEEVEEKEKDSNSATQKMTSLIEDFIDPKSQIAFTRNDDKPQGIFKNIFEISREISNKEKSSTSSIQSNPAEIPSQEPKVAELVNRKSDTSSTSESELERNLLEKLRKSKSKKKKKHRGDVVEEWVEAEKVKKKKHKSEKKKKKHKSRK